MWLSGQQKRPNHCGEGQTGIVTVGGGETAVMLDSERRGLEVYAPAGYRWTPEVDQRVLVIQGQGEIPCIVGVRQDGARPQSVDISADAVSVSGQDISVQAGGSAAVAGQSVDLRAEEDAAVAGQSVELRARGSAVVAGQSVDLRGEVFVNGTPLETVIARIVAAILA